MKACIFPGQGAQFVGMGKELYQHNLQAQELFERANQVLGFRISDLMFEGSEDELKMTKVTQPAVFIHSVVEFLTSAEQVMPDMVAGHSLGEFSALVACGCLTFEDALRLVAKRAFAMQSACDITPSAMAVVLKCEDSLVEEACAAVVGEIVVPANYNSPGQLVISGTLKGLEQAMKRLREKGVLKMMMLKVGGAFHSPLMLSAQEELQKAIIDTPFHTPHCPIYQNKSSEGTVNVDVIRQNVQEQLTNPVLWSQSVQRMVSDGATEFIEYGPGNVLKNLIKRIAPEVACRSGNAIWPEE